MRRKKKEAKEDVNINTLQNKKQNCIRDFGSEVFELTADMIIEERTFNAKEQSQHAGIAECILRKYDKVIAKI